MWAAAGTGVRAAPFFGVFQGVRLFARDAVRGVLVVVVMSARSSTGL